MLPAMTRQDVLRGMRRFDSEDRGSSEWADWTRWKNHRYAIRHDGQLYPVKRTIYLATDVWVDKFSGGEGPGQANEAIRRLGFEVVNLPGRSERNPTWARDELILALDLYLSTRPHAPGDDDPRVIELSRTLRRLAPRIGLVAFDDRFRNPNGVAMKLMNFRALDPEFTGRGRSGLKQNSAGDRDVWREFGTDPQACAAAAAAIRARLDSPAEDEALDELDEDAAEGRLLTVQHRRRERDPRIVARKKRAVLAATGNLACEACGFDFAARYGERGDGFIECHHKKPLATLRRETRTKLEDLAVVCSNCHRMLHRRPWITVEALKKLLECSRSAVGTE